MSEQDKPSDEKVGLADDLFAGAGGWDLAARDLGIEARGVEIMPEARATRDAAGLTTIHDDVWTFEPDGKAAGLIASPPCQTFSVAGKGTGRRALDDVLGAIWTGAHMDRQALLDVGEKVGDARTALVLTPLHFAMTGGYRWLAWEQVPTVLPVWEACAEVLDAAGWSTWTGYLHSEQYGVPQTRKRALLLASLDSPVQMPTPTHSQYYSRSPERLDEGVSKWVSMAEALGWGLSARPSPTVTGGGTETGGAEPIAKLARYTGREDWVMRNNSSANAAERGTDQPAPTLYFGQRSNYCAWEYQGRNSGPGAARDPRPTSVPSFTVRAQGSGSHPSGVEWLARKGGKGVRVSVEEAGVLQSFPADHPWQGAQGKQYLQVGNAIPPGLALPALAVASGVQIENQEAVA